MVYICSLNHSGEIVVHWPTFANRTRQESFEATPDQNVCNFFPFHLVNVFKVIAHGIVIKMSVANENIKHTFT